MSYASDAEKAVSIIKEAIRTYPSIMKLDDPFELFKIEELQHSLGTLNISLAQAGWALKEAQHRWEKEHGIRDQLQGEGGEG